MAPLALAAKPQAFVARRQAPKPVARRASLSVRMMAGPGKGGEEGGKAWDKSVYGRVGSAGAYNLFANGIAKAGLADQLTGTGPFTLFAPDDDAFGDACKSLGTTKMELLNLPSLPDIVKNHVVSGLVKSADLKEGMTLTTMGGRTLTVTLGGGAKVNGVAIKKADVSATNGVIHVVKAVITN